LEELERRDCPAAPVINTMSVLQTTGRNVQVSGTLTDEDPGMVMVYFNGVIDGGIQAGADGAFSFSAQASALGSFTATAYDIESLFSQSVTGSVSSQAPLVIDFSATRLSASSWRLSGQILDESPDTVSVHLAGLGAQTTTSVDADGLFSVTLTNVPSGTNSFGALAVDSWGRTSAQADSDGSHDNPDLPSIANLSVVNTTGRMYQVSGTVNGVFPAMATVTFDGVLSGTVHPNPDGSFSFTAQASTLGDFTVTPSYGKILVGDTIAATVANDAPTITDFATSCNGDGTWTISGHICDESPQTLTLVLSGASVVDNLNVTPNGDGTFSAIVSWGLTNHARISVEATDSWNATSATVTTWLGTTPPAIITVTAVNRTWHDIEVSGTVKAGTSTHLAVMVGGVLGGDVYVDDDGTFSFTQEATDLGDIQLIAYDDLGGQSDQVTIEATTMPPTISSLTMTRTSNQDEWVIAGQLSDETIEAVTVVLSGPGPLNNRQLTVTSDGSFGCVVTLSWNATGTLSALATDCWGITATRGYLLG